MIQNLCGNFCSIDPSCGYNASDEKKCGYVLLLMNI